MVLMSKKKEVDEFPFITKWGNDLMDKQGQFINMVVDREDVERNLKLAEEGKPQKKVMLELPVKLHIDLKTLSASRNMYMRELIIKALQGYVIRSQKSKPNKEHTIRSQKSKPK